MIFRGIVWLAAMALLVVMLGIVATVSLPAVALVLAVIFGAKSIGL